jgi:CHAT domain-containing protein
MAEGTDLLPASYDESLSQSGIAFAGITSALFDKDFSAAQHDGILSAREIAQMDYSGVDLIVLSACQTAQGYMTDDGIYGLQRSLKNAGVKAMILSLWSVDDNGTAFLMQAFYRHMKESGDIHTAFMQARQDLINTQNDAEQEFDPVNLFMVPSEPNYNWPEFYNAFILIDIK